MNRRGFTLIELLVVVAIISLLSSIVLAGLKEAREKAQISAFRQEVYQFIKALELYKADKGEYPKPSGGGIYSFSTRSIGLNIVSPIGWNLESEIAPYIKKIPKPYTSGFFTYRQHIPGDYFCAINGEYDSPVNPDAEYIITISGTVAAKGFDDWTGSYLDNQAPDTKCFSLQ
jgi:prepilin-type N-terminal cleavage/methylation domain-containing protein